MFSINTSDKLTVFMRNIDVWKWKWANIFIFNGKLYVLVFRRHVFAKRVGRFKLFNKYKDIINILSIKTCFKFYSTFIQSVFFIVWKENVGQYWNLRGSRSNTIYLNIKLVVKYKYLLLNGKNDSSVAKFSKSRKSFLVIPLTKVSRIWKDFLMQI